MPRVTGVFNTTRFHYATTSQYGLLLITPAHSPRAAICFCRGSVGVTNRAFSLKLSMEKKQKSHRGGNKMNKILSMLATVTIGILALLIPYTCALAQNLELSGL